MADTDDETYEIIEFDEEEEPRASRKTKPDSSDSSLGFISATYFKLLFSIFVMFMFVSSDVFIDKVLGRIDGAVEHKNPTTKGTFVQALVLVLLVMIMDIILRTVY
jgi:hypothetical protein